MIPYITEYELMCQRIDDIVAGVPVDIVYTVVQTHAIVRRFFGNQNLYVMGYLYGRANGATPQDFTSDAKRYLAKSIAFAHHPDKGGNLQQYQYLMGPFKEFFESEEMNRLYAIYLVSMDNFHQRLDTGDGWITYETIDLPDVLTEEYSIEEIAEIPTLFSDREVVCPLFCLPEMSYDHSNNRFQVAQSEFESNEENVTMAYKAKFGKLVYFALRFAENPQLVLWIKRKDAVGAKYLDKLSRKAFFRFKKVRSLEQREEFSMVLRSVEGLTKRAVKEEVKHAIKEKTKRVGKRGATKRGRK